MNENPIEYWLQAQETLNQFAPKEVAAFFEKGLTQYLAAGESLEESFEMKPSKGQASYRTKFLLMKRDNHVTAAHALCEGSSSWQKAVKLSKEIKRFKSFVWPSLCGKKEPPKELSNLNTQLFYAFSVGIDLPGSARQFHDIATRRVFSPHR